MARNQLIQESLVEFLVSDVIGIIVNFAKHPIVYIAAARRQYDDDVINNGWSLLQYDVGYNTWTTVTEQYAIYHQFFLLDNGWKLHRYENTYHHFDLKEKKWDVSQQLVDGPEMNQYLDITSDSMLYIPDGGNIFQWNNIQRESRYLTTVPPSSLFENKRSSIHYFKKHDPQHLLVMEEIWPPVFHRYDLQTDKWEKGSCLLLDWMHEYEFVNNEPGFFNGSECILYYGWIQHKINKQYKMVAFDILQSTCSIHPAPADRRGRWAVFLSNNIDVLIFYEKMRFVRFNFHNGETETLQLPFDFYNPVRVGIDYI